MGVNWAQGMSDVIDAVVEERPCFYDSPCMMGGTILHSEWNYNDRLVTKRSLDFVLIGSNNIIFHRQLCMNQQFSTKCLFDETSVGQKAVDEISFWPKVLSTKRLSTKCPVNQMSVDETSADEMSVDEMSVDETSADEMSVDEMSCHGYQVVLWIGIIMKAGSRFIITGGNTFNTYSLYVSRYVTHTRIRLHGTSDCQPEPILYVSQMDSYTIYNRLSNGTYPVCITDGFLYHIQQTVKRNLSCMYDRWILIPYTTDCQTEPILYVSQMDSYTIYNRLSTGTYPVCMTDGFLYHIQQTVKRNLSCMYHRWILIPYTTDCQPEPILYVSQMDSYTIYNRLSNGTYPVCITDGFLYHIQQTVNRNLSCMYHRWILIPYTTDCQTEPILYVSQMDSYTIYNRLSNGTCCIYHFRSFQI